jgi:hypothetical protein
MAKGLVTQKEVDKHLAALPDKSTNAEYVDPAASPAMMTTTTSTTTTSMTRTTKTKTKRTTKPPRPERRPREQP